MRMNYHSVVLAHKICLRHTKYLYFIQHRIEKNITISLSRQIRNLFWRIVGPKNHKVLYRVAKKEWPPYNTKFGLFPIILCKIDENISHWLGLDDLFATSKPTNVRFFHKFCMKWSDIDHCIYCILGGPFFFCHPVTHYIYLIQKFLLDWTQARWARGDKTRF